MIICYINIQPRQDTCLKEPFGKRQWLDRETAERMIKMGKLSLDEIALCVPALSLDELKELETEVMQLA